MPKSKSKSKSKSKHFTGLLAAALTLAGGNAAAQEAGQAPLTTPGWNEFVDQLRALPAHILAKLPEEQQRDPWIQQEVGRLALEALAARSLEAISADADNPVFLPSLNQTLNVYQPNSDTIYKETPVDPAGSEGAAASCMP